MSNFLYNLAYLSSISIIAIIAIICLIFLLIWLFIRSAVASGTKHGILEAYNTINNHNNESQIKTHMFDNEEKTYIYILLFLLFLGLIVVYMFL